MVSISLTLITGQFRCMKLLCKDERVDWNTRDEAGNTPLLFCLKGNQLEMARLV